MPYIWFREEGAMWAPLQLFEKPIDMGKSTPAEFRPEGSGQRLSSDGGAVLFPVDDNRLADTWVLVWSHDRAVRVNGLRSSTGIRVVSDRDEIKIDSMPAVFFSGESQPRVESFAGAESEMFCPRCKNKIEPNTPVVRCTVCSLVYHENIEEERNCWSYAPCCGCGTPTEVNGDFRWTPEEVWG